MADSAAAVAALVYRLRDRLDKLQDVVNDRQRASLAADLADLAQLVRAHITAEEERSTAAAAPVWFGLSQAEYDTRMRRLTSFVDLHLRVTYRDYLQEVLHDCWAQHPAALWELGNLQAEWDRVYGQDPPSLTGALVWHDRWLPGVRARLAETMRGCREDRCRHQRPQVPASAWGTR
jgi:hypothetical protein